MWLRNTWCLGSLCQICRKFYFLDKRFNQLRMKYKNFTLLCQSNNESIILFGELGGPLRLDYITFSKAYDADISFLSPQTKIHKFLVVYDCSGFLFPSGLCPIGQDQSGCFNIVNFTFFDFIEMNGRHIKGPLKCRYAVHSWNTL